MERSLVKLTIYDIQGRRIAKLYDGAQAPGRYDLGWNGVDLLGNPVSTGVYLAQLRTGHSNKTIKMLFTK